MPKIKPILQQFSSDCGSACITTILDYYGKTVSLRKISEEAGTDSAGTSGLGIIKAAQKFGLSCTGIRLIEVHAKYFASIQELNELIIEN